MRSILQLLRNASLFLWYRSALARVLSVVLAVELLLVHLLTHVVHVEKHLPLPEIIELLGAASRRLHVSFRIIEGP